MTETLTTIPSVASTRAGLTTGLISDHLVVSPPSARISTSAAKPTPCAMSASSKARPPSPAWASTMPSPRKSSSDGSPKPEPSRAPRIATISTTAPTSRMTSRSIMADILADPGYGHATERDGSGRRDTAAQSRGEAADGHSVPSMSVRTVPRPYPSLAFRRLRAFTILMLAVALVNTVAPLLDRPDAVTPVAAPARTVAAAAPAAPPPAPATVVANAVSDWHAKESGHLAVVVAELQTGRTTAYGDSGHAFATASAVKVDILATLLLQEQGRLSSAQKASASAMIRRSSNGDATALWKQIGREK